MKKPFEKCFFDSFYSENYLIFIPVSRQSSSSSTSSPSNEASRQPLPPIESMNIQDPDNSSIYEEIDDDVVSIHIL